MLNTIKIDITKLANTGEGIGNYEGRTVFVPGGFSAETLQIALQNMPKKGVIWGKIAKVLKPHIHRISTDTTYPGCDWQNLAYSQQLLFKEDILKEALKYYGKFEPGKIPLKRIVASPQQWQYRNKITLTFSSDGLGVYLANSHDLITAVDNPLAPANIKALIQALNAYFKTKKIPAYDPGKDAGELRQLILKWNSNSEVLLGLVTRNKTLPKREYLVREIPALDLTSAKLIGLVQNINKTPRDNKLGPKTRLLWGRPYLTESVNDITYAHSLAAFFQTNTGIAQELAQQVCAWVEADRSGVLFDLYGGIGFLSLPLARKFGQTVIVEEDPDSIEMGLMNCSLNGLKDIKFQQLPVEIFLKKNKLFPAALLIDPPRKGCSSEVLKALLNLAPGQMIYISCSPVTLARDLRTLTGEGQYYIKEMIPYDMFPQTPHLEIMTLLEKSH